MTGRTRRSGKRADEQLRLLAVLRGDVKDVLAVRCQRFQASVLLVDGRWNVFVRLSMILQVPIMPWSTHVTSEKAANVSFICSISSKDLIRFLSSLKAIVFLEGLQFCECAWAERTRDRFLASMPAQVALP